MRSNRDHDSPSRVPTEGWIHRHRGYIMLGLCCLTLSGVGVLLNRHLSQPRGSVLTIATARPTSTPSPTSTPAPLRVYVSGAVAHPGVYRLPWGSIVEDAVSAAGGARPEADLARINMARELLDQEQIHVPSAGETPPPQSLPPSSSGGSCVNLNLASLEELDSLPGIGPAYAQRIIEYRLAHGSFREVEELLQVRGIGPAILEMIHDRVCL